MQNAPISPRLLDKEVLKPNTGLLLLLFVWLFVEFGYCCHEIGYNTLLKSQILHCFADFLSQCDAECIITVKTCISRQNDVNLVESCFFFVFFKI